MKYDLERARLQRARRDIAKIIVRVIGERGLLQRDVAAMMDCSQQHVSRLVNQPDTLALETLWHMCMKLDVHVELRVLDGDRVRIF